MISSFALRMIGLKAKPQGKGGGGESNFFLDGDKNWCGGVLAYMRRRNHIFGSPPPVPPSKDIVVG
jgi:hypothetical protein